MAFSRFLISGVINTGTTYVCYLLLSRWLPYIWAYSITYLFGILLGYVLNAYWVFKRKAELRTAAIYPLSYILNYAIGVGLLWLLVDMLKIAKEIAPLIVVAVTTPLMYVLMKYIFRTRSNP